ncbi:hypothetical protein L484_023831 [Morus notabilis]|uniref:F-box/kelch-repeat protein SKIP25 n=1 Tax=Morus notabilis TaxID=981085 RepID=W9RFR0_9ROSA|nr:F-box/kelch-repeat protein SKIP25 [Morus notabilis]EXB70646.1 hypothetical protein L484_023831 [Morus notabilis]
MESKPKEKKPKNADQDSSSDTDDHDHLLQGLPNHLTHLCLSRTNPSNLYSVCRSWRRLIYSPHFPPVFSLYAILSSTPSLLPDHDHDHDHHENQHDHQQNSIELYSLDPFSNSWKPLPPPPLPLHFLHNHPSFLSRKFPIQSLAVSRHGLVLIAGTDHRLLPALSAPLVFLPTTGQWLRGPPVLEPRRWCAVGSAGGSVYVASGIGCRYKGDVARSMEKWDMEEGKVWKWEKKASIRDGRFSREAIEMVTYKGKFCMVNVKGHAAKDGAVYDVERDVWEEMPAGMVAGWNGPAAATEEEEMYVVDESKGVLSKYNGGEDRWEKVVEAAELKGAEQIAAGRGRVCAVCENGRRIAVVDVTAAPATVRRVEPPRALPVVAVHILPRMSNIC